MTPLAALVIFGSAVVSYRTTLVDGLGNPMGLSMNGVTPKAANVRLANLSGIIWKSPENNQPSIMTVVSLPSVWVMQKMR